MTAEPAVLIVSCSLNPGSRSHVLALAAHAALRREAAPAELLDLRDWDLPICDGTASFDHPSVAQLSSKIAAASAVLLAAPVYNYDLNAAAKNLVEMTGRAWNDKLVGFLCTAGGHRSYMSPFGFANSLMFDFRSVIIPRFVYATKSDFDETGQPQPDLLQRIDELARQTMTLARGVAWARTADRVE